MSQTDDQDNDDPDHQGVTDLMARIDRQQAQQEGEGRDAIAVTCDQLAELGITQVRISYDGCGDSGAVETVTAFQGEDEVDLPKVMEETLAEAAEKLLPSGWEINDGSFGELALDVAQRKLTREHNWRVSETEYDEHEFNV